MRTKLLFLVALIIPFFYVSGQQNDSCSIGSPSMQPNAIMSKTPLDTTNNASNKPMEVTITYRKLDVVGLTYIDEVSAREKRIISNKKLKETTLDRFKKYAIIKGGSIVYIPEPGFGIFVSQTITGYIYQ